MIHTHDQLFKKAMMQVSEVKLLLQHLVTPTVSETIDLKTLELQSNSLLDDQLREYFSDVVYRCQLKGQGEAKICLLFEHKSYPDKHLLLQVLYYMASTYRKQVEEKRLELIIPIIFVHGKRVPKIRKLEETFTLPSAGFRKYLPTYAYELIDVNQLTDEQLKSVSSSFLLSMLLAFRTKGDKELLLTYIRRMFKFVERTKSKYLRESLVSALATYLFHYFKLKPTDMIAIREALPEPTGVQFSNTIERLRQEGREEGQAVKNIEKNIETTVNFLLEFPEIEDKKIAKIVAVQVDFVHAVRRTFTQRLIKKRREHFYKFYVSIDKFEERYKAQATTLFERLRKKIKKSKVKITAPPRKKV